MDIYITDMTKDHIPMVADIEKQSFSIPWSEDAFVESLSYEHAIFIVAVVQDTGEVAGYAGMYKVFNEGDITNIAVHPKHRGCGIGNKILRALINKAKEIDIKDIILEVRQSNDTAIHLYEKNGFKNIGIRKNFYEKPVENAIIMHFKVFPL